VLSALIVVLVDGLVVAVRVESLIGNVVVGWCVLHLAVD
jgi:hypothetical protein